MNLADPVVAAPISLGISVGLELLKRIAPKLPSWTGVPISIGVATGISFLSGHPDYTGAVTLSGGSALLYDMIKNLPFKNSHPIGEKK